MGIIKYAIRFVIFAFVLGTLNLCAQATTAVTLHLFGPNATATSKNAFVRFELANYGTNVPKVIGTNTIIPSYVDGIPDNTGLVSINIIPNTNITPTNTYYHVTYFRNGNKFYTCDVMISGVDMDLDSASCMQAAPPSPLPFSQCVQCPASLHQVNGTGLLDTSSPINLQDTSNVHVSNPSLGNIQWTLQGTLAGTLMPAFSGDVSSSAGSTVMTVNKVNGVSYPASPSINTSPIVTAVNTANYQSLPNCGDATHALAYNTTTHQYNCQFVTGVSSSSIAQFEWERDSTATNYTLGAAGNIVVWPITISGTLIVNNISIRIQSTSANHNDLGLYSYSGGTTATLVAHIGGIAWPSTGLQTFSFAGAPITLTPGTYLFAWTSDNAAAGHPYGGNVARFSPLGGNYAVTTSVGGVLPSSITLNTPGLVSNIYMTIMFMLW